MCVFLPSVSDIGFRSTVTLTRLSFLSWTNTKFKTVVVKCFFAVQPLLCRYLYVHKYLYVYKSVEYLYKYTVCSMCSNAKVAVCVNKYSSIMYSCAKVEVCVNRLLKVSESETVMRSM